MADIGNTPCGAFDACWRTVGIRGWRPHRPLRLGSTPMTIDVPTQKITSTSRRCPMRIKKPYTVEVVGDRTIVIARHADHTGGQPMAPFSVTIGHEFVQQRYICRLRAKIADITRFMGLIVASPGRLTCGTLIVTHP